MKKILLVILLFAGLTGFKPAATRHITGVIYGNDDKLPIVGASIRIKGTNVGTQTNISGFYAIDVPDGNKTLVFSYIGYKTQEVNLGKKDVLDIYLDAASNMLSEVVVTGYTAQQKKDITGSVAVVDVQSFKSGANSITVPNSAARVSNNLNAKTSAIVKIRGIATTNIVTNQAAPGDESYKSINENGFDIVKSNPLSTFSVDVDDASYSNVRRFINNGRLPPVDAVRIEEMINYFKYNIPGPTGNEPVAIRTELSTAPWNTKHNLLRISLKAKTIDAAKLPPSNLVFLIDVSGSMDEVNKLPLVKASMKLLTGQLRPQDRVAIVTYAGEAGIRLQSTPGDDKERIDSAIDELCASGSTAGGEGIKMAYRVAKQNFMKNGNNRIVMATDGDFNVGPNSDEDMEHLIVRERESKVAISIMGFGMGNYKDSKMETLADKGNGNYAYIDNITEAHKALVTEFGGTLFTIAKDVKLQVEFNPARVQAYRLLGYEDRMLAKEDFNNDKKDAGDMGSGHTVTAFYEIVPAGVKDDYAGNVDPLKYQKAEAAPTGSSSDEMATIKFRYKAKDGDVSKLSSVSVKGSPIAFDKTSADFRFASAIAEFGMLLRDSQFKQQSNFEELIKIAKAAKGEDDQGYRSEFVRLAESARLMAKSGLAAN